MNAGGGTGGLKVFKVLGVAGLSHWFVKAPVEVVRAVLSGVGALGL